MAVLTCKMCGGSLTLTDDSNVCECEFCGTRQTVPATDNDKKITLFNRANRLRMNAEFDKAAVVYENIVSEFPEEAEAYWGLCLCSYGIEYVDDPLTGEKKPTCHRTMPTSIMEDSNFELACDCSDVIARRVYRDEAKTIDRIQKDILEIVSNEKPYDVFICYKETTEDGSRTEDSVLAQDIYDSLTEKGLKVFFSRITLENKLGQQFEPYIYAALSSSKVMIAVGTQFEYYDAVWVKNEWMRFLFMMRADKSKVLIPCYKDLDAYDMPKEFRQLQAQDMGKLGWLQDLTRGVLKICGKDLIREELLPVQAKQFETEQLLKRIEMFLMDGEWDRADTYIDRVLDMMPENGKAYFYRFLQKHRCASEEQLMKMSVRVDSDRDFSRALQFADAEFRAHLNLVANQLKLHIAYAQLVSVLKKRKFQLIRLERQKAEQERLAAEKREEAERECLAAKEKAEQERQAEEEKAAYLAKKKEVHDKTSQLEAKLHIIEKEQAQYESLLQEKNAAVQKLADHKAALKNLHGLFTGSKRKELERLISEQSRAVKAYDAKLEGMKNPFKEKQDILYQQGMTYYQAGFYSDAVPLLIKIRGYKNVNDLLENDKNLLSARNERINLFRCWKSSVFFGSYPQTRSGTDRTPIEWIVLHVKNNQVLLISRYALDIQPYDTSRDNIISWEKSTLRNWLNNEFLNNAFTAEEQTAIMTTTLDNHTGENYLAGGIIGSYDTKDKVFLFSYKELQNMSLSKELWNCFPTAYSAKKCKKPTDSRKRSVRWWLRTPIRVQVTSIKGPEYIANIDFVSEGGFHIGGYSDSPTAADHGIRPGLYIDLTSDFF